jgi:glycosyltransferase involved in cell wall biosynthesis
VAEALAAGLPVIISNKVTIFEAVQSDGAGLISDDTLASFTSSLERWLQMSAAEKAAMAASARNSFLSRFDISITAREYLNVVRSIISSNEHIQIS